jgi:uncharacterized protein (TIGR00369 family)
VSGESFFEALARAKSGGDFGALTDAIPYARFLGVRAERIAGELLCRLTYAPDLVGNTALPALHGGVLGALLESAAVVHVLWQVEAAVLPKTITITVDYLRSAGPVDTFAKGRVTRLGRRIATVQTEAWQDDRQKPVATAVVHLLLTPVEGAAAGGEGRGP